MAIEVDDRTGQRRRHALTLSIGVDEAPGVQVTFSADIPSLDPDVVAAAIMQMLANSATPKLVRELGHAVAAVHIDTAAATGPTN